jgi:hypothetical protein
MVFYSADHTVYRLEDGANFQGDLMFDQVFDHGFIFYMLWFMTDTLGLRWRMAPQIANGAGCLTGMSRGM